MDINGTEGPDNLGGTPDADVIRGFGGNDQLNGAAGDDQLYGGEGDDQLTDNVGGNDKLYGEGGNDTLTIAFAAFTDATARLADGGDGNDIIHVGNGAASVTALGGEGDDQFFVSSRRAQSFTGGPGQDYYRFTLGIRSVITDFQTGVGGDRLDVAQFYHNGLHSNWNGIGDPFELGYAALSGSDDGTILWLDPNGGGDSLVPFLFLPGTDPLAFTADNFTGMSPVVTIAGPPVGGVLQGGLRNDLFTGGQSAHIEASFGEDRVGYSGALAEYDIVYASGSWYVLRPDSGGGPTMVDRLDQVERAGFSGGEIEFLPMAHEVPSTVLESRYPGAVAGRPGGGFVLSWSGSVFGSESERGIFFQFHDGGGTPLGEPQRAFDGSGSGRIKLVYLADGSFVVVGGDTEGPGVPLIGRVFEADGTPRGASFPINTTTEGHQSVTSIAALAGGGFVVGWFSTDSPPKGQVFAANGAKVGAEFPVGSPNLQANLGHVAMTGLADGGFAAVWLVGTDAYVGRFDSAGLAVGEGLKLSVTELNEYVGLDAATLPDGRALLAWDDGLDIWARIFDPAGGTLGEAFKVNDTRVASLPDIAIFDDGSFVIAWEHSFFERKTIAQRFDSEGQRVGNDFTISVGEAQAAPKIAALEGRDFVAVWDVSSLSPLSFGTGLAIVGQPVVTDRASGDILPDLSAGISGRAGTESDDTLFGAGGDDLIDGRGGADRLVAGQGGLDIVLGGAGTDRLEIDWSALDSAVSLVGGLVLSAGGGHDGVFVSAGGRRVQFRGIEEFVLRSGGSADTLAGGGGDDLLDGGGGNDVLRLERGGDDAALGGSGNDVLYFGNAVSAGDVADGGEGRDAIVLQGNVTVVLSDTNLVDIESISIQSGANATFGDTANAFYDYDVVTADGNVLAGQQLIVNAQSLRAGEDFTFDGSAEKDGRFLIYGGHGVDDLTGGDGVDVFFFEGSRWGASDRVDGGAGRDALTISGGSGLTRIEFGATSFINIESISLNNRYATDPSQKPSYDIVLHNGNVAPGATLIVNGSSIPLGQVVNIDGRGVHDGNLTLFGGGGHDVMFGGDGADLMIGSGGADALTGGAGADTFRYDSASDSAPGREDLIGDFQSGSDRFDLTRVDANSNAAGDQAFTWIGSAAFTGVAGQLRSFEQGGYRWIAGDTDGDGDGDLVIALQPGAPLIQGDFLL
jgi:Ca2+-binding RTX toxin-like protein